MPSLIKVNVRSGGLCFDEHGDKETIRLHLVLPEDERDMLIRWARSDVIDLREVVLKAEIEGDAASNA